MPLAPFVFVSYAAGLSGVRLGPYLLGTAVGLVPWSVLYVGLGASVASIDSWSYLVPPVLTLSVVMAAALLTVHFWRRRQRRGVRRHRGKPSGTSATPDRGAAAPPGPG